MDTEKMEQWAQSHETSIEIVRAIHAQAKGNESEMQRVWENANRAESAKIVSIAWELAEDNTSELFWGETSLQRP